jgi:N utilization substance protein B
VLTRRHIRVKVFQTLYAMSQTGSEDLTKAEKFLENASQAYEDLHLMMLAIFVELRKKEIEFQNLYKNSHLKADDFEKKLTQKFIENQAITLIESSKKFQDKLEKRHIRVWKDNDMAVLELLKNMKDSAIYDKYISSSTSSVATDTKFLKELFEQIIAPSEKLFDFLTDQNIYCADDYPLINTLILKSLNKLEEAAFFRFSDLYKDEEDAAFGKKLLHKTALNQKTLQAFYEGKTHNWEFDRISIIDITLLNMALAEFCYFSSIPTKVTINEYVEISKEYSTKNSSLFINGLLDFLLKNPETNIKFQKTGRGLISTSNK